VIEFDELCLRQSPPLWLWVGISRRARCTGSAVRTGQQRDQTHSLADYETPKEAWVGLASYLSFYKKSVCIKR